MEAAGNLTLSNTRRMRGWLDFVIPNLSAGTLAAVVTLSYSVSYAALIFSGEDLQYYMRDGMHVALMSAWLVALLVTIGSSFHFAIAGPDSNATAVLALMAASIAQQLRLEGAIGTQVVATVLVMLSATAIATGILVYALGAVRRGRLIRFMPYPVLGGFMAGTGYLILSGGFKVLTGQPMDRHALESLQQIHPLGWIVALTVAGGLLVLPRVYKHYIVMPAVIIFGCILFYLALQSAGMTIATGREHGMLFRPMSESKLSMLPSGESLTPKLFSWSLSAFSWVRWDILLAQWQDFLAMTVVVVITILLNATGVDLATQSDVDFDRELRINGLANIVSGVCGGMIGYLSISRSLLNYKAGATSRLAGVWTAALCCGATYIFANMVSYFPRPVLAGLLIFLGLSMLREWIIDMAFKLPFIEYGLIVAILLLIALHGLIPGVTFGLLVAGLFFVYSYSQTTCIKNTFSGSTFFSNKERTMEQTEQLKSKGRAARALTLQGYIFFGTSSAILEMCRECIIVDRLRHLLLDFRMVQGVDASAVLSFRKLHQICDRHGVQLVLTGLAPKLEDVLKQNRFLPHPDVKVFTDLDRGLESIEDELLRGSDLLALAVGQGATHIFAEYNLDKVLGKHFNLPALQKLRALWETVELKPGEVLFRRGDHGDGVYFIEEGQVSVLVRLADGQTKRLRTLGPGTVVGEMALYSRQPRSADVQADAPCRIKKLSSDKLMNLEHDHPELAIQFHIFVIKLLSTRLAAANEEIRTLI